MSGHQTPRAWARCMIIVRKESPSIIVNVCSGVLFEEFCWVRLRLTQPPPPPIQTADSEVPLRVWTSEVAS